MTMRSMLAILTLVVLSAPSATANDLMTCVGDPIEWVGVPQMGASARGFPDGHARSAALADVVARWNRSPAAFRFDLTWNQAHLDLDNGENEIWFTGDDDRLDGAPAATWVSDDCTANMGAGLLDGNVSLVETDIIFACDAAWVTGCAAHYDDPVPWHYGTNRTRLWRYGGDERPFRTTAMHEFGHALGLEHEDGEYNIMGEDWTHIHVNGDAATPYPGEDASEGAVRLYGRNPIRREDVSVTHWRYDEPDGEYSTHERTRIFDANDVELDENDETDWFDYLAAAGQRIRVEFTFENNGSTTQAAVPVWFYLSRDRVISFGDIFLTDAALNLSRNDVYTRRQTIDLPVGLAAGDTYYIIVVIDPMNAIGEVDEDNNITASRAFVVR